VKPEFAKDRPSTFYIAIAVLVITTVIFGACAFASPVVATVNGSPITKSWLDSVHSAFDGDRSLQALVNIAPQTFASSPEEAAAQPGLTGRQLRVELLWRRLNLEVVDTMLGRMGLDPTEERKQSIAEIDRLTAGRRWESEGQRQTVVDFVSRWIGDRTMLIEAIMPSVPDDDALRTLFETFPAFGAKLCFSVIKVQTPEEARKVEERLQAGESFSQVAADLSVDLATKPRRGDVGCVMLLEAYQRLQDPAPFAVAFSLGPGQARGPIEGPSGGAWYVRLNDSGSTGYDFDSARPQLFQQYPQARLQVVSDRFTQVALELDVRVACPDGRWNPENLVLEDCNEEPAGTGQPQVEPSPERPQAEPGPPR
jgi:hypothetical protein